MNGTCCKFYCTTYTCSNIRRCSGVEHSSAFPHTTGTSALYKSESSTGLQQVPLLYTNLRVARGYYRYLRSIQI